MYIYYILGRKAKSGTAQKKARAFTTPWYLKRLCYQDTPAPPSRVIHSLIPILRNYSERCLAEANK